MTIRPAQVFISYQRADEAFARQVREHLAAHGVKTWMDQYDIPVGTYWPDEIDAGLGGSDIVVGILSPDAIDSRNVKNEWDWALQNEKRLLLLQVAPCLIPHRYISINFIDATSPDPAPALASLSRALGGDAADAPLDSPVALQAVVPIVPIPHAPRGSRPMPRVPPFVAGRQREQAILGSQLDKLLAGRGSLVLVGGEAGIGKTTLTHWLAAEAEALGAVVLSGGCYDLTTTPPYGPWGEIVRGWPEGRGSPPVPEALRGGEAMARLQSQVALFELATDLLATAGTIRPIVLLLEDLHWADQPSLDLMRYVARLVVGFRVMLVATYRDDEITRRHPLFALIPALAREAGAERISLQRLGPDAVGEMIASRYAIAEDERVRLAGYVQRVTEGNPFFAGEVLRALEESRAIEQGDAGWRLGDLDRVQVPDLVRQVIEGRLAHLGEDVHRQLQVAAVIGHEVPVDLWIAVSGQDEVLLSEVLDRATEARIVEELRGGAGFRFTHALIRETLYEGLGLLRRRSLHRRAGEALVDAGRPDPDAVAHHFSQASDQRMFDWLIHAGDRAKRSYAWLIAAERYEQAAAIIADDPERAREYGWLLVGIAQMLRYADAPRAVRYIDEAAKVGEAVGDAWLALFAAIDAGYYRIIVGRLREGTDRIVALGHEMEVAFRDGRLDAWKPVAFVKDFPQPVFDYTLRKAIERPDQAVVLSRSLGVLHMANTGRFLEAQELAGQLADVWPPDLEATQSISIDGDWRSAFADLYLALAFTEHALGLPQQAIQSAQVALREYTRIPHYYLIASSHSYILRALLAYQTEAIGRRRAAANDAAEAQLNAQGAMQSGSPLNLLRAPLWIIEGAWVDAYTMLHSYLFPRDGSYQMAIGEYIAMSELAIICALQGRREEAQDIIRDRLPDGADTESGGHPFYPVLVLHDVATSLALDNDDMQTAHDWLEARDRWMEWSGAVLGQVQGHLGWARYHRQSVDLDAAEEHARTALDKASVPRQPLGLIASRRLLGELATERGNHDSAATHLSEALSLADACAAPFERALTLIAQAELAIATGADPRETLAEARTICERLEARPTLERIAALGMQAGGVV